MPEWIKELTAEYRESQDVFKVFLAENFIQAEGLEISMKDFVRIAKDNGVGFFKRAEIRTKIDAMEGVYCYQGVGGSKTNVWYIKGLGGQKESADQTEGFLNGD